MSLQLWLGTLFALTAGIFVVVMYAQLSRGLLICLGIGLGAAVCSSPVLLVYALILPAINRHYQSVHTKTAALFALNALITMAYSVVLALVVQPEQDDFIAVAGACFLVLFGAASVSVGLCRTSLYSRYFGYRMHEYGSHLLKNQNNQYMEPQSVNETTSNQINKPVTKGLITAALILLMLIPTWFISSLVEERQARQAGVVKDVAAKWATAQTVTGPYLYIPYYRKEKDAGGKELVTTQYVLVLPDELSVTADIIPEQRLRSIYKVLLYRSSVTTKGNFVLQLPKDIDPLSLKLADARVCIGISDFKGIEKKVDIRFNGNTYTLMPGLPATNIDSAGLSAAIDLTQSMIGSTLAFDMPLQLKGSEQLHFVPLGGNSQFSIRSAWTDPSFDGTVLPGERNVTSDGFTAKWVFNKANLPFGTVLKDARINKEALSFGVSMLQPADQYAKTTRSVKYAVLIIGLTFSLFFIIELMQKKAVHPVQYVLIGLALVIFYTLLLSISEFIFFDNAYLVAASATVSLISLYARGHFNSWKTAGIFASVLSGLYSFIFILIRLEDTALLLGSIGLFIILALVMYASRKINWYGNSANVQQA